MKKKSNLSRLMGYAGGHKILTYLSWVLSVMSALLALVPFWYIWCIIHDILEVSPDFSQAENVTGYGWSAVLFAVISIVVYIAALMCSHLSAFRVAANIRKELMRHIAALPLGVTEKYGSLCARYVSVAALEPFTILRSFPLPYFSVTPSGNAAIWRISSFRILAATRNALKCEHIKAAM